MAKQLLIPTRSTDDVDVAVRYVSSVADPGDEIVLLVLSEVPDAEFAGTAPPPIAMEPLAQTTGYAAPRVPNDMPVFVDSAELMEKRQQEIRDILAPRLEELHDKGYRARLDVAFTDEPMEAIKDAAGDLDTTEVYVTSEYYGHLETDRENIARVIPGT